MFIPLTVTFWGRWSSWLRKSMSGFGLRWGQNRIPSHLFFSTAKKIKSLFLYYNWTSITWFSHITWCAYVMEKCLMYLYHIYICIYIYMYILYVDSTVYIVLHFDHQASYHFHFSPFRPHNAKAKRPKTSTCHSKSLVALPHDESCMADFQELRCLGCKKQNTKKKQQQWHK